MELNAARIIAEKVLEAVRPHCEKVEVAGSIRRGRAEVHDIDLVLIPSNQGQLLLILQTFGRIKGGPKILQCVTPSITIDVYIATPDTWANLLLVRTGSKAHNIKICQRARQLGMVFHADGRGLCSIGAAAMYGPPAMGADEPVKVETEADIFKALNWPYKEPGERE